MNSERISPFWVNGYQPFSAYSPDDSKIKLANQVKDSISVIIDKADKKSQQGNHSLVTDELIKLNTLKQQGILTEEEFIQQKNKILNS